MLDLATEFVELASMFHTAVNAGAVAGPFMGAAVINDLGMGCARTTSRTSFPAALGRTESTVSAG